jgi:hypothetical protein
MAGATIPTSSEQRARVLQLHSEGYGRNEIHRRTGVAAAVVTKIVSEAGLSFDRTATRAATAARQDDLAEARSQALQGMYAETLTVLQRLTNPGEFRTILKASFGEEKVKTLDFIPARDYKELAAAAAQLALAANRLEQANNPQAEKVRGLLGDIAGQLGL